MCEDIRHLAQGCQDIGEMRIGIQFMETQWQHFETLYYSVIYSLSV